MPSLNPTPLLLAPTLLILSLPLFTFAIFTSILAFTALLARVFLVYIELAVVITHDYFFSRSPSSTSAATATATTPIAFNSTTALPPGSRIHSRTHSHSSTFRSALSTGSTLSTISTLPQAIYPHPPSTPRKRSHIRPQPSILLTDTHSDLSASTGTITPGTPQVRDYEGVGGWRLPLTVLSSSSSTVTASVAGVTTEQDTGDPQQQGDRSAAAAVAAAAAAAAAEAKEEEDEQRWTGMNRRLELPAGKERKRRHRRSLTTAADHFLVRMPVAAGYGSQAGWVTSSGWGRGRGRGTGGDRDRDRDSGEGKGDQ